VHASILAVNCTCTTAKWRSNERKREKGKSSAPKCQGQEPRRNMLAHDVRRQTCRRMRHAALRCVRM
jgi:hypothetical protein